MQTSRMRPSRVTSMPWPGTTSRPEIIWAWSVLPAASRAAMACSFVMPAGSILPMKPS